MEASHRTCKHNARCSMLIAVWLSLIWPARPSGLPHIITLLTNPLVLHDRPCIDTIQVASRCLKGGEILHAGSVKVGSTPSAAHCAQVCKGSHDTSGSNVVRVGCWCGSRSSQGKAWHASSKQLLQGCTVASASPPVHVDVDRHRDRERDDITNCRVPCTSHEATHV